MSPRWHGQPQRVLTAFTAAGTATKFGGVTNLPSIWNFVPNVTFSVGVTATFPVSGTYQSNNYVTDPENDTITLTKNSVFVQGVTWDGGKFITNGTGSATTSTGHILTANDGHGHFVDSSTFQIALVTTVSVTVSTSGNRVQLSASNEGPNTVEAHNGLAINWANVGGDWRDANDTAQGSSAFATNTLTSQTAPQTRTFTVGLPALINRLRVENTGIFVRRTAGTGFVHWAGPGHSTQPAPTLSVTTNAGQFNCTLLQATYLTGSVGSAGTPVVNLNDSALLKFDLSGVTGGDVTSATLTMVAYNIALFTASTTFGVFYLDMPSFVTSPALELGGVELGIAASVTNDLGLESHPSIIVYDKFDSLSDINNGDWWWQDRSLPGYDPAPAWATQSTFAAWPDGLGVARITAPATGGAVSFVKLLRVVYPDNWHNSIRAGLPNTTIPKAWSRTWANIQVGTYEEMYLRYLIEFEEDFEGGLSLTGMLRMPRLSSVLEDLGGGTTPEEIGMNFSYAPGLYSSAKSYGRTTPPTHPGVFRAGVYAYDVEAPIGTGSGEPIFMDYNVCFKTGQRYTLEQYVKFNTWNGQGTNTDNDPNHWNADGILRMWIDGVRVLNITDRKIRVNDKMRIFFLPWGEFYETSAALADHHIKFGSMAVSNVYVGPALKPLPTWAQSSVVGTWMDIPNTRPNLVPEPAQPQPIIGAWQQGNVAARLEGWSGATLRRNGSVMILGPSGGHGDYFFNWMTEFNLGANSPQATLLSAGSDWNEMWPQSLFASDKNGPHATHTYYTLTYCQQRDWLVHFNVEMRDSVTAPFSGLAPAPPSFEWFRSGTGGNTEVIGTFDYQTKTWLPRNTIPDQKITIGTGGMVVVHPATGDVYYGHEWTNNLHKWDQAANVHYTFAGSAAPAGHAGSAIDPVRNRIFNAGTPGFSPALHDCATGAKTTVSLTGAGAGLVRQNDDNAMVWVEGTINKFLYCTPGAGGTMRFIWIDPTTFVCTEYVTQNPPSNMNGGGILTNFQYAPELRGVVLMNRYNQNIKYLRLW